jgi:hypothetical protein
LQLFRLQTIARGAGYVDTLFYLLKAANRPVPVAPVEVVASPASGAKGKKPKHSKQKELDRQVATTRGNLVKSIHETFLATAMIQLDAADFLAFQQNWTPQFVTGRLELAEWMQGDALTVHVYTCTCYPYDAFNHTACSTDAQQFYEHSLARSDRCLRQVYQNEHGLSHCERSP